MKNLQKCVTTGVCMALCVVLPMVFHAIPEGGKIFCPMYIPVLLCGMTMGWKCGLACGIAGPVLSMLFTQMPTAANMPWMMLELALYGVLSALGMRFIRLGSSGRDAAFSVAAALLIGKNLAAAVKALMLSSSGIAGVWSWIAGSWITGYPGVILQFILLPLLVKLLEKHGLAPVRYSGSEKNSDQGS